MILVWQDFKKQCAKQLEKVIFFVLAFVVSLYAIVFYVRISDSSEGFSEVSLLIKKMNIIARQNASSVEAVPPMPAVNLKGSQREFAFYGDLQNRDMFHPFVQHSEQDRVVLNPYELVSVIRKDLPFIWRGLIQGQEGKVLYAQINSLETGETFFVKPGDDLNGYNVLEVAPAYVDIKNQDSEIVVRLEQNKVTLEGKISAKIKNIVSGQTFQLVLNDELEGWVVRDIGDDYVRLNRGDRILYVKKETV